MGDDISIAILDEDGFAVAEVDCEPILHNWSEKYPDLKHWARDEAKTVRKRSVEEYQANAHLLAAAKKLFEAAESALSQLDYYRKEIVAANGHHADLGNAVLAQLQAALSLALGEGE